MTTKELIRQKIDAYYTEYKAKFHQNGDSYHLGIIDGLDMAERILDTLEEPVSEDERIRKFLVDYFVSYKIDNVTTKLNGVRIDDILNYLEKQKEQKSAEWSEEDEETLKDIIAGLEATKQLTYRHEPSGRACYNKWIAWLKSLRPVSKESLQPHWKPSEEQMEALLKAVDKARELHYTSIDGYDGYNELRSLYEQIKKLM